MFSLCLPQLDREGIKSLMHLMLLHGVDAAIIAEADVLFCSFCVSPYPRQRGGNVGEFGPKSVKRKALTEPGLLRPKIP